LEVIAGLRVYLKKNFKFWFEFGLSVIKNANNNGENQQKVILLRSIYQTVTFQKNVLDGHATIVRIWKLYWSALTIVIIELLKRINK
jgi:hypothetical protein